MGLRILLVDDSPHDRGMVRRELRKEFEDVEILEVTTESEFSEVLNTGQFDLVITDFHIRWTDGLRVLRAVKERMPECPVLMFTATGNEEVAVNAMKGGLDDYIIKNVKHLIRLRAAIRSSLYHSKTRVRADQLETRLGSLLRNLRVGVFRRDQHGTITEANDAAAEILTVPEKLVGCNIADFLDISEDHCLNAETAATRADGVSIWISINEREVLDDSGNTEFEGIIEDITERRNAHDELQRMQDEIAHVSRVNTMTEIASGIAHELKQPLQAIANFTEAGIHALTNSPADVSGASSFMNQVLELAQQSGQVIAGLQDFTRSHRRKPEPTKIGQLIERTLEMLQFELRTSRISLTTDIPSSDIVVEVDAVQIQQVLVNLISNAIDSINSSDSMRRKLKIQARLQQEMVEIVVIDSGDGIADDQLERLFVPYVSSKPDGSGIGLSISSRIVNVHDGHLDAWNNADQGASFRFTLPVLAANKAPLASSR